MSERADRRPSALVVRVALVVAVLGAGAVALAVRSGGASAGSGGLTVAHAYLDEPANPDQAAVRLVIANRTDRDDVLTGVSSPDADEAMVHRSSVDDRGMSTMAEAPDLAIPAGQTVRFEPGGLHVMVTGLHRRLAVGDRIELDLAFAHAGTVRVEVAVVEPGSEEG